MARKKASSGPGLFDALSAIRVARPDLPASWLDALASEFEQPYYRQLQEFLAAERASHEVYPSDDHVLNALRLTPLARVRALILGQDPYHDEGQAHGLCFSVPSGVALPPSLRNIFRELRDDLGCREPDHGTLTRWAEQGVLLLNSVLTVRAHEPASHQGRGWEQFVDAVIRAVNAKREPATFVLWGNHARKKLGMIDAKRHFVIESAHPSPLSARNGFFGSRPFSRINANLIQSGFPPIDWQLENRKTERQGDV